jgi:ABC-type transport system substrate-binding protein
MKIVYEEKDYLIAVFLKRFYSLLDIDVEIMPGDFEWSVKHISYPNIRPGYSWDDEDWWMWISSFPSYLPELLSLQLTATFHCGAPWQMVSDFLMLPLDQMYQELLKTPTRDRRFEIYKRANEYIADQALGVFTVGPLGLYGVNQELDFVPHPTQYLYLDYSSVTEKHWSLRDKND